MNLTKVELLKRTDALILKHMKFLCEHDHSINTGFLKNLVVSHARREMFEEILESDLTKEEIKDIHYSVGLFAGIDLW